MGEQSGGRGGGGGGGKEEKEEVKPVKPVTRRGAPPSAAADALARECWHRVALHRELAHQVLVFVHTRRDTQATAEYLLEQAQREVRP